MNKSEIINEFIKLFPDNLKDQFLDIPIDTLIKYLQIKDEKNKVVRLQKYEEAAKLRDKEKQIFKDFPEIERYLSRSYRIDDFTSLLTQLIRERKINDII